MCVCVCLTSNISQPACYERQDLLYLIDYRSQGTTPPLPFNPSSCQMLTCTLDLCFCDIQTSSVIHYLSESEGCIKVNMHEGSVYLYAWNYFIFTCLHMFLSLASAPFASLTNNKSFQKQRVCESACVYVCVCRRANMWFRFPLWPHGQIYGKAENWDLSRRRYGSALQYLQSLLSTYIKLRVLN